VLTAERNVKFHSSQTRAGQFTAVNAGQGDDQQGQDDTKLYPLNPESIRVYSNFFILNLTAIFLHLVKVGKT
jgi:hypothetical protein